MEQASVARVELGQIGRVDQADERGAAAPEHAMHLPGEHPLLDRHEGERLLVVVAHELEIADAQAHRVHCESRREGALGHLGDVLFHDCLSLGGAALGAPPHPVAAG